MRGNAKNVACYENEKTKNNVSKEQANQKTSLYKAQSYVLPPGEQPALAGMRGNAKSVACYQNQKAMFPKRKQTKKHLYLKRKQTKKHLHLKHSPTFSLWENSQRSLAWGEQKEM